MGVHVFESLVIFLLNKLCIDDVVILYYFTEPTTDGWMAAASVIRRGESHVVPDADPAMRWAIVPVGFSVF